MEELYGNVEPLAGLSPIQRGLQILLHPQRQRQARGGHQPNREDRSVFRAYRPEEKRRIQDENRPGLSGLFHGLSAAGCGRLAAGVLGHDPAAAGLYLPVPDQTDRALSGLRPGGLGRGLGQCGGGLYGRKPAAGGGTAGNFFKAPHPAQEYHLPAASP